MHVFYKVFGTLCTKNRPQGISSSRSIQDINFAFYGLNGFTPQHRINLIHILYQGFLNYATHFLIR